MLDLHYLDRKVCTAGWPIDSNLSAHSYSANIQNVNNRNFFMDFRMTFQLAFICEAKALACFRHHPITEVAAGGNLIFYGSADC